MQRLALRALQGAPGKCKVCYPNYFARELNWFVRPMASRSSSKSPVGRENKKRRVQGVKNPLAENESPLKESAALVEGNRERLVPAPDSDAEGSMTTEREKKLGMGSIELIVGPMFSGKTTALIDRIEVAEKGGRRVLAIKSAIDSRYAKTEDYKSFIVCHSGGKVGCYSVNKLSEFKKRFSAEYEACEVLAIDEAQFFTDLVDFCSKAADVDGKKVHVAGLDGDFRREPFKLNNRYCPISKLLPMCDKVTKKCAQCMYCENEAPFTFRTVEDSREILVGGADLYVPVCRKHFILKSKQPLQAHHEPS